MPYVRGDRLTPLKYSFATLLLFCFFVNTTPLFSAPADGFNPERNDLSVCRGVNPLPVSRDAVDVKQFAARLHGTWSLRTRTVQGATIDTDSKYYFDFDNVTGTHATGWSMFIDRGNLSALDPLHRCAHCLADASVGALWKVTLALDPGGQSIHLKMDGEYYGSYENFRKGIKGTEQSHFGRYGSAYLASKLVTPSGVDDVPDDIWDRISVTDDVMVYMSCKDGFVDRLVKVSSDTPTVGGERLPAAWKSILKAGVLLNPPHIDTWKWK